MIKKYKEHIKESLLDKLEGPSEKDFWNVVKDYNPMQLLYKSILSNYLPGIKKAIEQGAFVTSLELNDVIEHCDYDIVKYILDNFQLDTKYNFNLLLAAIRTFHNETFINLFEKNKDYYNTSIIHVFDMDNNKFIDINITNNFLRLSKRFGNEEIVNYLKNNVKITE